MFRKFNLAVGLLALALFSYAQHQGWNLFEDRAASGHSSGSGSGRSYHK